MTYGFRPENWPAFQAELQKRGIAFGAIEKVEIRPEMAHPDPATEGGHRNVDVTVTLRSGRVASWKQRQEAGT